MDRMQPPPPNYYGVPYPSTNPNEQPQMMPGPGREAPNYYGNNASPMQNNMPSNNNTNTNNNEIEHTFKSSTNAYIGKKMKVYCSFPDSSKWHDVIFEGRLVYAENDHLILRNLNTDLWTIIVSVYINYIELSEA